MAPILSCDPGGLEVPSVLHIATLGGVTACLMRHFRASLASLPLLAQPLCSLALGTWSEEAVGEDDAAAYRQRQQQAVAMMMARRADSGRGAQAPGGGPGQANGGCAQDGGGGKGGGGGALRVRPLQVVHPSTPLTAALGLLLEAGVSALPVVDERGVLLDVYARADITQLCRGNAYNRLQWEDVTVGQALSTAPSALPGWVQGSAHGVAGADGHQIGFGAGSNEAAVRGGSQLGGGAGMGKPGRVAVAARDDALRTVVERLSLPGVRRLVVVQRGTGRVEGVVSLSDVAALLFM
ncbi:hypothetical protein MNEG_3330 [Monoraphidium neglectum]|uniref:CBS domain-containing protein n=1 Tax=Monoraphidium neglectum TaxID=145388 RepID=A0A0D2NI72_9CHLO|nr:hypothetical protein MNEG_3330 [Monoraphidium neglectum]KIZ04631.1 hypothetical protein MNEG_3330 [Monoraphidium neglectum]|eukprot:XP_013903650.1 hypothetical protein MNEG_3330 [Monoraphidium neglectum]